MMLAAPTLDPFSSEPAAAQLCEPGSGRLSIRIDGSAAAAVEMFQANPDMRLLPVVDYQHRPVGALFEKDIRRILFNPYGHALLRNPNFGRTLGQRVRICPVADIHDGITDLLDAYARSGGYEGMILTHEGKLYGVIHNQALVQAAARHEIEQAQARLRRYERLGLASRRFEGEIAAMIEALDIAAHAVDTAAHAVADRGLATGQGAAAVAGAALQTDAGMAGIAEHSRSLADALDQLRAETVSARQVAGEAAQLVTAGQVHTEGLGDTARMIESILALIESLSGKVGMLAINATIEAARAGDAGRGFAVVASEVRTLATQTREAAARIFGHVRDVKAAIDGVLAGQSGIARVIATVGSMAQTVDAAVEAQRGVTAGLADEARQAALASTEIRRTAEEMKRTAEDATSGSLAMRDTADALARSAATLRSRVSAFLLEVSEG